MPRIVNEEEYALRRNEILDVVQRLVFTKGFDQMSIQDIIAELKISKGAFYHYFNSKPELLDALTERVTDDIFAHLNPIIQDSGLSALDKMQHAFSAAASWKTANRVYLVSILRVWFADENAVIRQRMTARGFSRVMPLLVDAIRQGAAEGVMEVPYTEQIGQVLITLMLGMGDATAREILNLAPESGPQERQACYRRMVESVKAYTQAIERILGARPGSLVFFDPAILKEWVLPLDEIRVKQPAAEL